MEGNDLVYEEDDNFFENNSDNKNSDSGWGRLSLSG